jgi:hypothetical protein
MVPILEEELAGAVGHDDRGWFPALLSELVHVVDTIIPKLFVDRAQDRVSRRSSKAVQLIEGQPQGTNPPSEFSGELLGQYRVVTSRTREELRDPIV